ncbi:hypothetical protein VKS41_006117 [Umbelopsis sp. WA50703]
MSQDIPPPRTPVSRSRSSSINFRLTTPEEAHPRQQSTTNSSYFDSADNLPNSISRTESHDIDEVRSPRAPLSRNQSTTSLTSTTTRSTSRSRRWYRRTPRNSIFTTASQLSRPPSYRQHDSLQDEQPDDANRDTSHLGGWPSFASQFYGIYFAFWLVLLSFLGAVSVFVPGLPQAAMVLWVPVVLYLATAAFMFHRRRSNQVRNAPQRDTSNSSDQAPESMRQMRLPDSYYFVINNTKDHTHPVVTLLPPPPNYRNAAKHAQRNSMEIEEVEPEAPGSAEQPQPQSQSTSTDTPPDADHVQINIELASDGSRTPELDSSAQFGIEEQQQQPASHPQTATMST